MSDESDTPNTSDVSADVSGSNASATTTSLPVVPQPSTDHQAEFQRLQSEFKKLQSSIAGKDGYIKTVKTELEQKQQALLTLQADYQAALTTVAEKESLATDLTARLEQTETRLQLRDRVLNLATEMNRPELATVLNNPALQLALGQLDDAGLKTALEGLATVGGNIQQRERQETQSGATPGGAGQAAAQVTDENLLIEEIMKATDSDERAKKMTEYNKQVLGL